MAIETQYNVVKVNELREITTAQGVDELIINDLDSSPLETKKISAENLALSIKDYILPIAGEGNDGELGGVKIGDGLTINPITGVLSNDVVSLNDLDDVIVLNPEANHVLRYNGVQWVNQAEGGFTNIIAGDGLSGGGTEGEIILSVNAGLGLSINNDLLTFNAGKGLAFTGDYVDVQVAPGLTITGNQVALVPGNGIIIQDQSVQVNTGKGLKFVGSELTADIGGGLIFSGNRIEMEPLYLQSLNNVEISMPSNGQGLAYQDGKWMNTQIASDWQETDETSPTFVHNKPPFAVTGYLGNGSMSITIKEEDYYYCAGGSNLKIRAEAEPVNENGDPIIGIFEFDWQSSDDGVNWTSYTRSRERDITYIRENHLAWPLYTGGPAHFRVVVDFTDLYGNEISATSETVSPMLGSVSSITSHPVEVDMSEGVTTGSFSVSVTTNDPSPEISYLWFVNGVNISAEDSGNMGYTFSNWNTNTLGVTRTDDEAYSYSVQCFITTNSFCGGLLTSHKVWLHGPNGCCGGDPPREPIIDRFLVTCYPGPISAYASMVGTCSGFIKGGTHGATPPGYTVHGRLLALQGVTQGPGYTGQYWPSGYCSSFYVTMDVNDVECNP